MILKEHQARDSWCPFGRRLYADEDGSGAGINRRHESDPVKLSPCLGAECMAWRWVEDVAPDHPLAGDTGFCGLAGRPLP
jgi:hypothetical protein